jgi:hypothetical protein
MERGHSMPESRAQGLIYSADVKVSSIDVNNNVTRI